MRNNSLGRTTPKPRVKARLIPVPAEFRHFARCGRCGQFLWKIARGYSRDGNTRVPAQLDDLRRGWRFDPEGRIWRPTETHLAQRRAADARVLAGTATESDRMSLRGNGPFGRGRGGKRPLHPRSDHFSATRGTHKTNVGRFGATADLPVGIQCPRCGAENDIEDPEAGEG